MILKQNTERPFAGVVWHGLPAPKHLPGPGNKKPSDPIEQSRLTPTGGTNHRHTIPGCNLQIRRERELIELITQPI